MFYAQPIRPRRPPPVLPRLGDLPGPEKDRPAVRPGVFASSDVFQGVAEEVRRSGRKLRIIEWLPKNYSTGIVTTGGGTLGGGDAFSAWGDAVAANVKPKTVWGDGGMLSGPATGLYRSRLVDLASNGAHYGARVSPAERLMLIAWIDTWRPYRSEDEILALADPDPKYFPDWPSPPRLRTAPVVRGEY